MAKNNHSLKQRAFQMLEAGTNRVEVKRYLTKNRVSARQAVVMLCQQEMILLKTASQLSLAC